MHGNVWQWCADLFNPMSDSSRVVRGGWSSGAFYCRASYRSSYGPSDRDYFLGFRLVRVPRPASGPAGQGERPRSR
jgi:formylglycine-generating enzyme required for sulfatase activity